MTDEADDADEAQQLRSSALKNIEAILSARRRAEKELLDAKAALEKRTAELHEQREWFEVTLGSIGDAVITTDTQGRLNFMNSVAEAMTGWRLHEAQGQALETVFRIVNEDTRERAENPVEKVLETGRVIGLANHTALIARDGSEISIEDSAAPIRDPHGKVSGAVMVFHDVTRRRLAERALRASEERLRAVVSQAALGIAVANLEGVFEEANAKFCAILGYSLSELRERTFLSLTHAADVALTQLHVEKLRNGEIDNYALDKRYLRKDGSVVWSSTTVTLLRSESGKAEHFIGIIQDISDRKRDEEVIREQAHVLALLNTTGRSIASKLDLQKVLQTVTDSATQLTGAKFGAFFYNVVNQAGESYMLYTLSGAPREAFEKFGLPRNTPVFHPTFVGEGVVRSADITQDPRYGTMAPHHGMPKGHLPVRSYLAVSVISGSGEVMGGLFFGHPDAGVFTERAEQLVIGVAAQAAVAMDNARLYEAAQREIASRERAEAALRETDRRKDEFLATLAHELRNPLAPIRQATLISMSPNASDAQRRWSHEVITRQVQHMSLLLDDLLDISRITRGTLELRTSMCELGQIIEAAVETSRPSIDGKQHVLAVELPEEPVTFAADPLRLAQVLSNLLTNAAKYTDPKGSIRLLASQQDGSVVISVSDTGIGIPAHALREVFTMFSQVESTQDRSEGGLGIGLALSKGVVELHGGTLEARSDGPGQGSEFMVRIPLRVVAQGAPARANSKSSTSTAKRRVLIADDNQDAADSLAMILEMEGHQVVVVNDGRNALAAIEANRPEVALLDIGMPELDGYEVARRVRGDTRGRNILLIAVTGWGQDADKARAVAAGFDLHFTKPVEPQVILELLRGELPSR
jgi:PAS domain S-box-containing protein